jgi:SulP family sulfate permease
MSGAQTLALKRKEKLHSNHELVGLGAANVGSALSGGFPVTGSLSRSAVNFAAGANTQLASLITAALLAWPWCADRLAGAAAAAGAGRDHHRRRARHAGTGTPCAPPGATTAPTRWPGGDLAGGVLLLGVEAGVVIGVALSMGALIWRASRPHIAVLGRIAGTEHFRNIERYPAETRSRRAAAARRCRPVLRQRRGGQRAHRGRAGTPSRHAPPGAGAVGGERDRYLGAVRAGGLNAKLAGAAIGLHLAEVKGPVMDRLRAAATERQAFPEHRQRLRPFTYCQGCCMNVQNFNIQAI